MTRHAERDLAVVLAWAKRFGWVVSTVTTSSIVTRGMIQALRDPPTSLRQAYNDLVGTPARKGDAWVDRGVSDGWDGVECGRRGRRLNAL